MRLLVCGNRDWTCVKTIEAWLRLYHAHYRGYMTMIHGGNGKRGRGGKAYQGADEIAHDIAEAFGWMIERYPADWSLGRKAGPIRNQYAFDHGGIIVTVVPNPGVLP